jgi:hypothetical protein
VKKFFVFVILMLLTVMSLFAVGLAWDPSPDSNVTGYAILYGTNSGSYKIRVDVGNQTNVTIQLPTNGVTYFFVATAYTINGVESLPSNEVNYTSTNSTPPLTNSIPTAPTDFKLFNVK